MIKLWATISIIWVITCAFVFIKYPRKQHKVMLEMANELGTITSGAWIATNKKSLRLKTLGIELKVKDDMIWILSDRTYVKKRIKE